MPEAQENHGWAWYASADGEIFTIGVMRKADVQPSATFADDLGRFFDSFAILP